MNKERGDGRDVYAIIVVLLLLACLIPSLPGDIIDNGIAAVEPEQSIKEDITEIDAPGISILSPENTNYDITNIGLNYRIDKPTDWVGYSLNGANNITTENIINDTLSGVTELSNIMPRLTAKRDSFSSEERPVFSFKYNPVGKSVDGEMIHSTGVSESNTAAPSENQRAVKKLITDDETIETFVYDASGKLTDIKPEIEKNGEGTFDIKLPTQRQFRAGKYTIKLDLVKDGVTYTQEQDFLWGVLAINVNKSIYLPNEEAFIGIGVLDDAGNVICDANVTLEIVDPQNNKEILSTENNKIKISPECGVLGFTTLPDYYANYTVSGVGTYLMNLTAVTPNGVRSIEDNFTVQSSVDFDVEREGPTRIYPPIPYVMNLTIKANNNYTGLIKEYVPASFVITAQDGLTVTTVGDTKILSWNKNLVNGETYDVYYEFDAPDVSPYLYLLGPLEIGSFKEIRQWQIASDTPEGPLYPNVITLVSNESPWDDITWTTPNEAKTDDGDYAYTTSKNFDTGAYMYQLQATDFGFNIPVGATIDGIKVEWEGHSNDVSTTHDLLQLIKGGTRQGDDKGTGQAWPENTDAIRVFGGETDLWNMPGGWTAEDINAADFGVTHSCLAGKSNTEPYTDFLRITVYYTADDTPPTISIDEPTTESPVYRNGGDQFWVNFTYTEEYPANYTVNIFNSTAVINTTTVNYPTAGTDQVANVSFYLNISAADGFYNVSVDMNDNSSNYGISYQNNSLVKDATDPTITIDTPTTSSPVYRDSGELFWVNFTYTEETPASYTVEIFNSTAVINTTTVNYPTAGTDQVANESFYLNISAADGFYNVSVNMYDNTSNYDISYQNLSVVKDTTD
ncbi:hypothetical protein ACFLY8_05140, partial [Halobacteriota archaeon]